MIDDQDVNDSLLRFQLEPELFLQRREDRRAEIRSLVGRPLQVDIELTGDSGPVEDGAIEHAARKLWRRAFPWSRSAQPNVPALP